MTLYQLESLTEDELDMALGIVNVISPNSLVGEIPPKGLTWFKREALIKKLLDAFPRVNPEYHATYTSLMEKIGVKVDIKKQEIPQNPVIQNEISASNVVSGSK